MKKILLFASVVILITVGCNKKEQSTTSGELGTSNTVVSNQIAYINIDSLVSKYDMYNDLRDAYEVKVNKAQGELTSKGRSLERDVMDYQDKVQKGLITRNQAATIEQTLNEKQQSFMQHRDKVMGELGEEEQVMLNQIHYSIVEFLKEFNSDYKYGMIISTNTSGPILNANPALDITKDVLVGLNKKYATTKGTQPTETKPAK